MPSPIYGGIGGESIAAPAIDIVFNESYNDNVSNTTRQKVTISWFEVADDHLLGYQVLYKTQSTNWETSAMISGTTYTIQNLDTIDLDPEQDDVEFYISAFTTNGVESPRTYGTYNLDFAASNLLPPDNLVDESTGGPTWKGENLVGVWTNPNPIDGPVVPGEDTFLDFKVEIYDDADTVGTDLPRRSVFTSDLRYEYIKADNAIDFAPATRSVQMAVYCRDTLNKLSAPRIVQFTNVAPPLAVNPQLLAFTTAYRLTHNEYGTDDEIGILIWHEVGVADFTPTTTNLQKDSAGTFHDVEATEDTTYYVKWAVYDTFGREELNIAQGQTITTFADVIVGPPPDDVGTITVTSSLVPPDQDRADIDVSWAEVANTQDYLIEILEYAQDQITVVNKFTPIIANVVGVTQTYSFEGKVNTKYEIKVRARNSQGAIGGWSPSTSHVTAADTIPPAAPTNLVTTNGIGAVALQWTNPTDLDYLATKVYMTTDDVGTPLPNNIIATIQGENYFVGGLTPDFVHYFWVTATDISGNESVYSTREMATPQTSGLVLGPDTVTTVELAQAAVLEENLSNGAVTETKIEDSAITTGKLSADSVTAGKIVAGSIYGNVGGFNHIAANSINATDIAANSITSNLIQAGTIQANDIAANTLTSAEIDTSTLKVGSGADQIIITDGYIKTNMIQADTITAANIDTSTLLVGSGNDEIVIADGYITAPKIRADEINSVHIGANEIITNVLNVQDGIIQTAHIGTAQITAAKIVDATITNAQIASATITTAEIGTAAIASAQIKDLAVTTAKIDNLAVDTLQIAGNAVTIPEGTAGLTNKWFPDTTNAWVTVATAPSVNPQGGKIQTNFSCTIRATTDWAGDVRILESGTQRVIRNIRLRVGGGSINCDLPIVIQYTTPTRTNSKVMSVQVRNDKTHNGFYVDNSYITVSGLKK
ncbi:MAG: hypothetical protein DRI65_14600 [Chloroflexota bacterium]|nr:MAG: hypothetical protein DRI65_14600 [Chloroflexota bacterium]